MTLCHHLLMNTSESHGDLPGVNQKENLLPNDDDDERVCQMSQIPSHIFLVCIFLSLFFFLIRPPFSIPSDFKGFHAPQI